MKEVEGDVENDEAEKAPVGDPIQNAMGAMGRWQIWICAVIFLLKLPVAWHQMAIIFLGKIKINKGTSYIIRNAPGRGGQRFVTKLFKICKDLYSFAVRRGMGVKNMEKSHYVLYVRPLIPR